jgi:hypothetical protein
VTYDNEYLFLYDQEKLVFLVRLVDNVKPLTKAELIDEINLFRRIGEKHKCFNSRIISLSGYRKSCYDLEQYTTILSDSSYIEELKIKGFPFELYPHNAISYRKIQEGFQVSNKVAIIQATGTGKSVLIAKIIHVRAISNPARAKRAFWVNITAMPMDIPERAYQRGE